MVKKVKGMKMNMKKIIYAVLICIIIAGGIVIGTMGLNTDITYSKSVRMDIYLGKTFENSDIKQIAKEVFGTDNILVQKVELFEDMVAITVKQKDIDNINESLESLNTKLNEKLNEKYELENKVEDIAVTYQPKIRLSSIMKPYLVPCIISGIIILVYAAIRFRKIGTLKTIVKYIVAILGTEAIYLSIIAITRIPVNRFVIPVGLLIYIVAATLVTIMQEKKLAKRNLEEAKKK